MIITINNPNVWLIVRKGLRGAGRAASGKEKMRARERGWKENHQILRIEGFSELECVVFTPLVPQFSSVTQLCPEVCLSSCPFESVMPANHLILCVSNELYGGDFPGGLMVMRSLASYDSLQPHGLRAACQASLSITSSLACSNPCLSSRWCHPTTSSSVSPFFCLQSFPASEYFPVSLPFASGG